MSDTACQDTTAALNRIFKLGTASGTGFHPPGENMALLDKEKLLDPEAPNAKAITKAGLDGKFIAVLPTTGSFNHSPDRAATVDEVQAVFAAISPAKPDDFGVFTLNHGNSVLWVKPEFFDKRPDMLELEQAAKTPQARIAERLLESIREVPRTPAGSRQAWAPGGGPTAPGMQPRPAGPSVLR